MYVSFEKPELISKLDNEIDSINKNVRTIGIIEAIQEEIKRQTKEETALEVTQQVQNDNVKRLYERGFHVEAISEMLGIPLKFVKNAIQ
jgi:regulator of replication initiation timing